MIKELFFVINKKIKYYILKTIKVVIN